MMDHQAAPQNQEAFFQELELSDERKPMLCVEERLRRALEGGRAPPVEPAGEPPRIMRLEGDGSDPNAWVCVLPRRPLPKLSPEDWAKLREDRAIYHKDSDIKRHRGRLDEELAFLLPKLAAHHEAKTAAH